MANHRATRELSDEHLEGLLEVVFIVCFADGEFGPAELTRFRAQVADLEDARLRSDRIEGLMLRAAMRIEKEGRDARLSRLRALLDERARHKAISLAIDVARADGLDDSERAAARAVAEAFAMETAELEALLAD